jgi:hypothetical protein
MNKEQPKLFPDNISDSFKKEFPTLESLILYQHKKRKKFHEKAAYYKRKRNGQSPIINE